MKLYVKSICYVCNNKTYNCHSCSNGYVFVEASDKAIFAYITELDADTKKKFIDALQIFNTN